MGAHALRAPVRLPARGEATTLMAISSRGAFERLNVVVELDQGQTLVHAEFSDITGWNVTDRGVLQLYRDEPVGEYSLTRAWLRAYAPGVWRSIDLVPLKSLRIPHG